MDEEGPEIRDKANKGVWELKLESLKREMKALEPGKDEAKSINPGSHQRTCQLCSPGTQGSDCGCAALVRVTPSPAWPSQGAKAMQVLLSHLSQLAPVSPRQKASLSLPYASIPVLARALILMHQCHNRVGWRNMEVWKMQERLSQSHPCWHSREK